VELNALERRFFQDLSADASSRTGCASEFGSSLFEVQPPVFWYVAEWPSESSSVKLAKKTPPPCTDTVPMIFARSRNVRESFKRSVPAP